MAEKISNKVVVALVFAAMVISIVGTLLVSNAHDQATSPAQYEYPTGNSGSISMAVKPTGAVVSLEVLPAEEEVELSE